MVQGCWVWKHFSYSTQWISSWTHLFKTLQCFFSLYIFSIFLVQQFYIPFAFLNSISSCSFTTNAPKTLSSPEVLLQEYSRILFSVFKSILILINIKCSHTCGPNNQATLKMKKTKTDKQKSQSNHNFQEALVPLLGAPYFAAISWISTSQGLFLIRLV